MEYMTELLSGLMASINSGSLPEFGYWSYVLLALLVAVEGPIATLLGAAASAAGLMRPLPVFFAAAIGNLSADSLWYSIGYMGGTDWLYHSGRRLGIRQSLIEHLENNMVKHATKVLFLAKLTVSFVIPTLIAAGLLKIPWKRWFPAIALAEMIWTGSLVLIGYYTTEAIKRVEQGLEYAVLGASILFVLFLVSTGRRLVKEWDKDAGQSDPPHNP